MQSIGTGPLVTSPGWTPDGFDDDGSPPNASWMYPGIEIMGGPTPSSSYGITMTDNPGVMLAWGNKSNPQPWGNLGPMIDGGEQYAYIINLNGVWQLGQVKSNPVALQSQPSWWQAVGIPMVIAAVAAFGGAAAASAFLGAGAATSGGAGALPGAGAAPGVDTSLAADEGLQSAGDVATGDTTSLITPDLGTVSTNPLDTSLTSATPSAPVTPSAPDTGYGITQSGQQTSTQIDLTQATPGSPAGSENLYTGASAGGSLPSVPGAAGAGGGSSLPTVSQLSQGIGAASALSKLISGLTGGTTATGLPGTAGNLAPGSISSSSWLLAALAIGGVLLVAMIGGQ